MAATTLIPQKWIVRNVRSYWFIIAGIWAIYLVTVYGFAIHDKLGLEAFDAYDQAAEALVNEKPVYRGVSGWIYLYPPLLAQLLIPLSQLTDDPTTENIWFAINVALLISSIALLARYVRPVYAKWLWLAPIFFIPIWQALYLGQITIIMLALLVGVWIAVKRDHPITAGVLLALAVWIKVFPILLVVYFLWKRDWAVIISTFVAGMLLLAFQVVVVGITPMVEFFETLFSLTEGGQPKATYENLSVFGFASRLFLKNARVDALIVSEDLFTFTRTALLMCMWLVSAYAIFKASKRGDLSDKNQGLGYALVIVTVLLTGSTLWVSGLPPFLLVYVIILNQTQRPLFQDKIPLVLAGFSFIIISIYQPFIVVFTDETLPALVLSIGFFGVTLLWGALIYLLLTPTE